MFAFVILEKQQAHCFEKIKGSKTEFQQFHPILLIFIFKDS
jgi:hypothetical protein